MQYYLVKIAVFQNNQFLYHFNEIPSFSKLLAPHTFQIGWPLPLIFTSALFLRTLTLTAIISICFILIASFHFELSLWGTHRLTLEAENFIFYIIIKNRPVFKSDFIKETFPKFCLRILAQIQQKVFKMKPRIKQKQSLLFNFCNILDLLICRTEKIAWWTPVFKPDFHIFPIMNNSGKFKEISWKSFYCIIPP